MPVENKTYKNYKNYFTGSGEEPARIYSGKFGYG